MSNLGCWVLRIPESEGQLDILALKATWQEWQDTLPTLSKDIGAFEEQRRKR